MNLEIAHSDSCFVQLLCKLSVKSVSNCGKSTELGFGATADFVGCEWGVDSVALARLFALSGFPFAIAHVNFGLRGEESDADEAFVRALGNELGVAVFVERVDVIQYRKQHGLSVQMAARELRYAFSHVDARTGLW